MAGLLFLKLFGCVVAYLPIVCLAPQTHRNGRALFQKYGTSRVEHVEFSELNERPAGPLTTHGRFNWMKWMWQHMYSWERDRLCRNLQRLLPSSAFSGYGGFEIVLAMIVGFVNLMLTDNIPHPRPLEAGDKSKVRQFLLRSYKSQLASVHVTQCISERLPADIRDKVKKLTPCDNSHIDAKRFAIQEIKSVVFDCFRFRRRECKFAPCCLHAHLVPRCDLSRVPDTENNAVDVESGSDEDDTGAQPVLDFHAAGIICKGVSRMANQEADGSTHQTPTHIWEAEHSTAKHSAISTECTQDSDADMFASVLPERWHAWTCLLCPTMVGELVKRLRRWTFHLDSESWVLLGHLSHFLDDCGRAQMMSLDDLFCLDEMCAKIELPYYKQHRILPVESDDAEITYLDLLTPKQREYLGQYVDFVQHLGLVQPGTDFLFDLDHRPQVPGQLFGVCFVRIG